jgi:hypothetical protein
MNADYNIHGAFPLLFLLPLLIPLCLPLLPFHPLLLTWNPPSCDRIRPPRSQVACKLTSPVPTLSSNPPSKFPEPQLPSASLGRPQEQSGVFCPEQVLLLGKSPIWAALLSDESPNRAAPPSGEAPTWAEPKSGKKPTRAAPPAVRNQPEQHHHHQRNFLTSLIFFLQTNILLYWNLKST